MKNLVSLLATFVLFTCFSQNNTIYYDSLWEETTKENHFYYRDWTLNKDKKSAERYLVKDYFKTGELQMTGAFVNEGFGKKQGEFKWYTKSGVLTEHRFYDDGKKIGEHKTWSEKGYPEAIVHYKNDSLHGEYLMLDDQGNVYNKEEYKYGKQHGWSYYYYPNSTQLSSKEYYENDSLIKFEVFKQNGEKTSIVGQPFEVPSYFGGSAALRKFLSDNLIYPVSAQEKGLQGKCYLRFTVDTVGSIKDLIVMKGVPGCPECDLEAVRVVSSMPSWVPGLDHNRRRLFYFNLPINFKLDSDDEPSKKRKRKK